MRISIIHIFVFLATFSFGQNEIKEYDRTVLKHHFNTLSKKYGAVSNRNISESDLLDYIESEIYTQDPIHDSIVKLTIFSSYYESSWDYVKESRVQLKLLSHYSEYLTEGDREHHYRKLAESFYNTKNFNLSIEFMSESLKYEGESNRDWGLSRIGRAYLELDFIDSSIVYYKKAVRSTENIELILSHTNSLGYLFFLDGKYKISELYYLEALNLHLKLGKSAEYQYCNILSNLSSLELKKGNFEKSIFYLDSVKAFGIESFKEGFQFEIYTKYFETYLALKDCGECQNYFLKAKELSLSKSKTSQLKLLEFEVEKEKLCGTKERVGKLFTDYLSLQKVIQKKKVQTFGVVEEIQRDIYQEHIRFTKENLSLKERATRELELSNSRLWKLFLVSALLFLLICLGVWLWFVQKRQKLKRIEYARKLKENLLVQENKAIALETAVQVKEMENQRLELMRVIDTSSKSNSMLNEISSRLISIKEKEGENKEDISQLIQFMASLNRSEEISDLIASNFGELEGDFKSKMRKQFPTLSDSEVQLLVFIRLGMSTKEMAQIKNVEPASIRIFKHRLKLKLKLSKEIDLSRFIEEI